MGESKWIWILLSAVIVATTIVTMVPGLNTTVTQWSISDALTFLQGHGYNVYADINGDWNVTGDVSVTGDMDVTGNGNFGSLQVSGANVTRGATVFVASCNATAAEKAQADFLCDGTADNVEWNAAIQSMSTNGGKLVASSGDFVFSANVTIDRPIWISGSGMADVHSTPVYGKGTIIHGAASYNDHFFTMYNVDNTEYLIEMDHFTIDGTNQIAGYGGGIQLYGIGEAHIHHISAYKTQREFLKFQNGGGQQSKYVWVNNLDLQQCGDELAYHAIWLSNVPEAHVDDNRLFTSGAIRAQCAYIEMNGNTISGGDSANPNVRIYNSDYFICDNNYFDNSPRQGLSVADTHFVEITNCFFKDCGSLGSTVDQGFVVSGAIENLVIDGNVAMSYEKSVQEHACQIVGTSIGSCIITNNDFTNDQFTTTPQIWFNPAPSNLTISNNHGFITEASGSANITSGNTVVGILHGLDVTPDEGKFTITPTNDHWYNGAQNVWVTDNATSTAFWVQAASSANGTNEFQWSYRHN